MSTVHYHQNDISLFHCQLRLFAHLYQQTIFTDWLETTGIDEDKGPIIASHLGIIAIARHPGHIFYNGPTLADNTIKKCRFSHIGPTDDSNYGHGEFYLSTVMTTNSRQLVQPLFVTEFFQQTIGLSPVFFNSNKQL